MVKNDMYIVCTSKSTDLKHIMSDPMIFELLGVAF